MIIQIVNSLSVSAIELHYVVADNTILLYIGFRGISLNIIPTKFHCHMLEYGCETYVPDFGIQNSVDSNENEYFVQHLQYSLMYCTYVRTYVHVYLSVKLLFWCSPKLI